MTHLFRSAYLGIRSGSRKHLRNIMHKKTFVGNKKIGLVYFITIFQFPRKLQRKSLFCLCSNSKVGLNIKFYYIDCSNFEASYLWNCLTEMPENLYDSCCWYPYQTTWKSPSKCISLSSFEFSKLVSCPFLFRRLW